MILIVMGVAGSGKSTVASALAAVLGWELIEGDDLHPPANRLKMQAGTALTDEDRWPWLRAMVEVIDSRLARGACAIITCSALKQSYRDLLARPGVCFVYLKVGFSVARERLAGRAGHFFPPSLLPSQLQTLEEPHDALTVNGERPVEQIVAEIRQRIRPGL